MQLVEDARCKIGALVAPSRSTMKRVDYPHPTDERGAFWRALLVGMACPSLVLGGESLPIRRIEVVKALDRDAMRGDWVRVGNDLRGVIALEEAARSSRG